jgi:hypothetical protein
VFYRPVKPFEIVSLTDFRLQARLSTSQFADVALHGGMLRVNGWSGVMFVVKTFAKEFITGSLQSSIFDMQEALRHPVLVAPIGYTFTGVDRTHRPSFVYPYIVGKTLSAMLNGTNQLFFHLKQRNIIGVLHAMLFLDSIHSFHGNLNTDTTCGPRLISYGPSRQADVFAFGVLLQKLFSDSAPSTPPKITEFAGLCVSEDPKARPTFAELAEDVSCAGAAADSMLG